MSFSGRGFGPWLLMAAQVTLSAPALAQVGTAILTGKVVDASTKQPAADVVVTVTSPALQGEQIAVTDATGTYRIPNLPPGNYVVRLEKEAFRPFSKAEVGLRADSTLRVDAELLPESLKSEEIVVVAQAPTVDVGSTNQGANLTADVVRRVPLITPTAKGAASKSFEALAVAAPGAQADLYGVSISGSTSPENQYLVEGMSVNSPDYGTIGAPLSSEFVKEVNIITGGYMPEFGRSTGGVLNVVMKSGGNEFHGGAWGEYVPGLLSGTPKSAVSAANVIQAKSEISSLWNAGLDVGGPIHKDKLWFYAGFQVARTSYKLTRSLNALVLNDAGTSILDESTGFPRVIPVDGSTQTLYARGWAYQAFGKLTYTVNPNNRVTLTLYALPSHSGGGGDYSILSSSGQPQVVQPNGTEMFGNYDAIGRYRSSDSYGAILNWTSDFNNKRVLWDTSGSFYYQRSSVLQADQSAPDTRDGLMGIPSVLWERVPPHSILDFDRFESLSASGRTLCATVADPNDPAILLKNPCPVHEYRTGSPELSRVIGLSRFQFKSSLTFFGEAAGHHTVKVGIDPELTSYDHLIGRSAGISYRELADGRLRMVGTGFLSAPDEPHILNTRHNKSQSILVGGFAQDSWNILDRVVLNAGLRYDAQFIYDGRGVLGVSLPNQVSPRVGAIYDFTQRGRSKVYLHYARFYEAVPLDLADRALSGDPRAITYVNGGANCDLRDVGQTQTTCKDPSNFADRTIGLSPNRKWSMLGAGTTPVDPDIRPQSSDEITAGIDYDLFKNARAGLSYVHRWMNNVIEDMSNDEATTYYLGNPGRGIGAGFPEAVRDYDAVTLQLQKSFSDGWLANASYTLAWLRGNYSGLFRPETQQLDPNINSDFDFISLRANLQGALPGDRRHQVRLYGAYDLALPQSMHATFGGSMKARSGAPSNYFGAHSLYGADQVFILPRGSGPRLPWVFSADLHVGYGFKFWDNKDLEIGVDAFNAFNFQAVTAVDQTYTREYVLPVPGGSASQLPGAVQRVDDSGRVVGSLEDRQVMKNFGNPVRYQDPLFIKFGVRTTF